VAAALGVSVRFVRKLIRAGKLPVLRLSARCVRVEATDLTALRAACRSSR
jgi:excisionase family DNA binding protein